MIATLWNDLRGSLRVARRAFARVLPYLSYLRSYLRVGSNIVSVWPERGAELGPKVALFIHFDRRQALADYVRRYVTALADAGYSVVFVSNSGLRREADITELKRLCGAIMTRRNVGYDFGAMRDAIDHFGLPRAGTETLLIVNDSVYGPLCPLGQVLDRIDFTQADVWGATDSWQGRYHLQSYFLAFSRTALASPAWRNFWRRVRQVSSKAWVIARYEVGLTQALLMDGVACRALWSYQTLIGSTEDYLAEELGKDVDPMVRSREIAIRRIRHAVTGAVPLNPTADLWRQLLRAGYPFLKIELLVRNPTGVPDVGDWRVALAEIPGADIDMIERDLQRRARNRAP